MLLGMRLDMIQTQTLRITPTFLSIIAEIDEFKGAWRALGSLAPEPVSYTHLTLPTSDLV